MNYENHQDLIKEIKRMKLSQETRESNRAGSELSVPQAIHYLRDRSSSTHVAYAELPLFIINQEASAKQLELKQFYRTEDSPAEIQVHTEVHILPRLDQKYFLEMFWQLEPSSLPFAIQ